MEPYRVGDVDDALEVATRTHPLRLEIAPRHVVLTHGPRRLTIADDFVVITDDARRGRRGRTHSRRRGEMVVVARDVPHEDIGIWMSTGPDRVLRLFGVDPPPLIADDGLARLRALDRLAVRLRQALDARTGVRRAFEVGRGLDKVLVLDHGDRLVGYVRPLFRAEARRAIEVHRDGLVVIAGEPDQRVRCRSRFGVTVIGDYVRFADAAGRDLARVAIRWISPEDRGELARRFGEVLDASGFLLPAAVPAPL